MGQRCNYALRENGRLSVYASHWGAGTILRDFFWGYGAAVRFLRSLQPCSGFYDETDAEGAIAIDCDEDLILVAGYDLPYPARQTCIEMMRWVWSRDRFQVREVASVADAFAQVGVPALRIEPSGVSSPLILPDSGAPLSLEAQLEVVERYLFAEHEALDVILRELARLERKGDWVNPAAKRRPVSGLPPSEAAKAIFDDARAFLLGHRRSPLELSSGFLPVELGSRPDGGVALRLQDATTLARTEEPPTPVAVGDTLGDPEGNHLWISEIMSGETGRLKPGLVRVRSRAREVIHARSIGPYRQNTTPTVGKSHFGGQVMGLEHVAAMEAQRLWWTLWESWTARCDDPPARIWLYESIVLRGEPRLEPTTPETLRVLSALLRGLCLDLDVDGSGATLRLLAAPELRVLCEGEVVTAGSLDDRGNVIPGGLFCPTVFGETEDPSVAEGNDYSRFGRIELPRPVVHPWYRHIVAALLRPDSDELADVVLGEREAPKHGGAGLLAIADALSKLDLATLPSRAGCEATDAALAVGDRDPADLMLDVVPVVPPNLRPMRLLDDGGWLLTDLNELYEIVVEEAEALRASLATGSSHEIGEREVALQSAVDGLYWNGQTTMGRPAGRLARGLTTSLPLPDMAGKSQDYSGVAVAITDPRLADDEIALPPTMAYELFRPFVYAVLEVAGHVKSIRAAKEMVADRTEEAAEALRAVLPKRRVLVFPDRLYSDHQAPMPMAGLRPTLGEDDHVLRLSPRAAEELRVIGRRVCVHVPLCPQALDEVRALGLPDTQGPDSGSSPHRASAMPDGEGWLVRAALGQAPWILAEAALRRKTDCLSEPLARLMVGRFPG